MVSVVSPSAKRDDLKWDCAALNKVPGVHEVAKQKILSSLSFKKGQVASALISGIFHQASLGRLEL